MNIIKNKVDELLKTYGSHYFKNFDTKKVTNALFAGNAVLRNLELKTEAIDMKTSPLKLVSAKFEELQLVIPWWNLLSEPVIIRASGLHVSLETKSLQDVNLNRDDEIKAMIALIINYAKTEYQKELGQRSGVLDFWMVKNIVDRIIDNAQIHLHGIQLEIKHAMQTNPFSVEVSLKNLEMYTTDSTFMNKQFTKTSLGWDNNTTKQIFKLLNLDHFVVSIRPLETSAISAKLKSRAYENSMENSIFRLSVQVRLIKNSNHGDQEPDYEATVKMHHNDLNLTQWQIQRVLNLLDFLKRLSDRLEDQRGKIRYRPTKRISDFSPKPLRKDEASKEDPALTLQRSNTVREWWEFAVLKVINKEKKSSKNMNKDQGKFYGLVKAMKIDQILNYEVPGTTMALYEEHFLEDLRKLAKADFDITKMVHDDSRRHTFESMVMLIPHHVQKVLAKRFARELAKEVKDRERNNWKNYAMSFIPYLGDSGLSEDQKQVQEMLKGEFKNDKQSFSKYICKVNIEIKKGNYTLVSDLVNGQKGIFGFYLDGFSIDVKAFQDKIEASIDLKNFELKLTKLAGQAVVSEFPVVKSTVEKGKSFFSVKLLNQTVKTKKSTSLEVYVQHVDLIFVNQIVSELIAFFKMQKYESESASGLASSMGKDFGGATKATKVMANANSSDISILVNVLSPRVLVPMEKKVDQISDETNLFVLYLGDMEFKHSIKSGTISALGSKLNLKLNHFKLEYWEDYKQGLQQLGVLQVDEYADNVKTEPIYVRNFVLLDLVANIRLLGANDGRSRSISVLLDYTDFHINPNVFHQMLKIQQIVDLKEELASTTEQLLEERYKIADNTVIEEKLAFKKTTNDRYEYKHLVFTKDTMYVFPDEEEIEPQETFALSGYNLSVAEEKKTGGYILHLWKDEQVLSIALKDFKQAKTWVNLLLQDLVGISPRDLSDKKKIEKSKINLEVIIKKCELALYNELFEPTTAVAIHYLEFRFSNDPHMKVKLSMDDMRIENFQDNFRSRGLQTILWIGSSPAPKVTYWRKPRPLTTKETKEVDESHHGARNDASVMSKSYTTRGASILPAKYDQLKTNNLSTIFNQSVVDRQPVADSFMMNATRARPGDTLLLNQTKNETLLLGEQEVGLTQEIGDFMRDNRSELGKMSKMSVEHVDLRSYEHAVEKPTQGTNPHLKEGFILYLEKPENMMEVDLHIVNFTATWDTEYVVNFQKKLNDYLVVPTAKAAEVTAPKKYKVKVGDPNTPDVVTMKAKFKFDRLCTILRSNNMNLFDMVFVDMKLLYTQMTKRMLVNIYSKRFAVRDLTAYPFTKKPEDLKQYSEQKKNLLFSFVESSTTTQTKQSPDDLDNHGLIVLAEVIGEPWLDDSRIGTKAEVIVNNGEINFFLQPTFRLLDILLSQMLGFITPDDIKKITVEEMVRRSTNPKRLSHNVFLKNLTVNMLPNFDVEKSLVMHMPSVMIANEQYVDKTRTLVPSLQQQINSENMNIDVRGAVIRGFRKGVDAIVMPQMAISFDKLLYFGYLEKILGPEQGKIRFMQSPKPLTRRTRLLCPSTIWRSTSAETSSMD